jgi:phosphoglycerate kinase
MESRIRFIIPTIEFVLSRGGSILIGAHTGKPGSKQSGFSELPAVLERMLGKPVQFLDLANIDVAQKTAEGLTSGQIVVLENLLQYDGEAKNQDSFAKSLAKLADLYVQEAFGSTMLPYASILKLPLLLPSYAGLNFYSQLEAVTVLQSGKERPNALVLGGVITEQKFKLLHKLLNSSKKMIDTYLISGGISYTFLKSRAIPVGNSLVDSSFEIKAFQLIEKSELQEANLLLPTDHIIADQYSKEARVKTSSDIPAGWIGLDVGPKTLSRYEKALKNAKYILWYGPLGASEQEKFSRGTKALAKIVARSGARTIVLGEETAEAVRPFEQDFNLVGGESASVWLEMLTGNMPPGITALDSSREEP